MTPARSRKTPAPSGRTSRSGPNDARRGARQGDAGRRRAERGGGLGGDQVEGRRAVIELLAAGRRRVHRLWVADGLEPSPQLDEIERLANRQRVPVEVISRGRLAAAARTDAPQGVLAVATPLEALELAALVEGHSTPPFLLVVDGVTDPHNLGALLRSAECAGVSGIVLPRHRSAHLSPTVAKVAAGAIEHLAFAVVGGIPAALAQLRELGVWTIGLAGEAPRSLYDLELGDAPVAVVVGSEDRGLAPLVRRRCDQLVAIPRWGQISSLNVSAAGAVACFELARQRLPSQTSRAQA